MWALGRERGRARLSLLESLVALEMGVPLVVLGTWEMF